MMASDAHRLQAPLAALAIGLLTTASLAQTTAPPPSSAGPQPSKGADVLTGPAAWQQLIGNTIVAEGRAANYTEFFAADGTVKHLDRDGKATGKWAVLGEKICFDYPDEDDRSCVAVEVEAGKGAFIDEDGARDLFEISSGNAKNL